MLNVKRLNRFPSLPTSETLLLQRLLSAGTLRQSEKRPEPLPPHWPGRPELADRITPPARSMAEELTGEDGRSGDMRAGHRDRKMPQAILLVSSRGVIQMVGKGMRIHGIASCRLIGCIPVSSRIARQSRFSSQIRPETEWVQVPIAANRSNAGGGCRGDRD